MAKHSDTESNSASNSSYSTSTSRRRSERLRMKYGDDLERFRYSVSQSPAKKKRASKAVQTHSTSQKLDEEQLEDKSRMSTSSTFKLLESVPEGKNFQSVDSTSKLISTDCVTDPSVVNEGVVNLGKVAPSCDVLEQYEEFCRQLQPYLYTDYALAAFQVAKDLYLVRKWSFIRVVPLIALERYVIVGSPNLFHNQTLSLYSFIPVPTDSILSPAIMDSLVNEALKEKFGHKISACIFAIMESDTTTAYYRITNSFEDLIHETKVLESVNELTNGDTEEWMDDG
ncbi:hypothetical protein GpartN1_g6406.t1 [Galdieria partita]|uniref:tRNA-splicing endonuclease subunit Sen15 domain-containing protein n=1 Tax=Galdieria partita TaxID=83374 RepID=A0A9C7Q218_9RHOD|nr:hypothetical protein GpartN1_g6406.t1 [Galdieria partita]